MARVERTTAQAAAEVIRVESVEHANTPDRVGGNLKQICDSALWLPASGSEHALLRKASTGEGAWTSELWSDGTYLGIGAAASIAASGTIRLAWGASIKVQKPSGSTATLLSLSGASGSEQISWNSSNLPNMQFSGSQSVVLISGNYMLFDIVFTHVLQLTSAGAEIGSGLELVLSGVRTRYSTETSETHAHAKTAVDEGADGSPVDVVAYTVPANTRATLRCKVCGEVDATKVPTYDSEFMIKVYRTDGDAIEYSAAVTPDDFADPDAADIDVTYTCGAAGLVTISKQNTSTVAMIFSGEIRAEEATLVGTGS